MSKQTAAVAVTGGSSPPASVIKLWREVEYKLLLQKGKIYISDQTTNTYYYYVCRKYFLKLFYLLGAPLMI